jgi:hypothetical protein
MIRVKNNYAETKMSMKKLIPSILLTVIWLIITSESSLYELDCSSIHTGRFFSYKNGQLNYTVIRTDSIQREINTNTGDTSNWIIHWTDNCTFTCQYLSGIKFKSEQETDFYKQSMLVFKIKSLDNDFYTYDAVLKYYSKSRTYSDTVWRRIK